MSELKEQAYKYAIRNAFAHKGKADLGAVIGKIKALFPDVDLKTEMNLLQQIVKDVNSKNFEEIEKEFKKFDKKGFELTAKEEKKGLPELDWASGETVVTRFAPNPNGPFHLGNARAAVLSHEFAQKYTGKFILRFDDTDPKVKKPVDNAEELFKEDLHWLNCKEQETFFASDRLDLYYDYMKKVLEKRKAYVCFCKPDEWRKKIAKSEACSCREKNEKEQLKEFEKMLNNELKEGEAVLRIKTDLKHKDPSVRDWWAAKIVNKPEHPRVKNKFVWPSYNFASAIDDHEMGITLIIRGQEHEQNGTKQKFLYEYFDWKYPHEIYIGRIKLQGTVLSTSKIKKGIESGEYADWDDPRLGTIKALRRRGFEAEALKQALIETGISSVDSTIEWNHLINLNKKLIETKSERVSFISDAVRLDVEFAPEKKVQINGKNINLNQGTQQFYVDKKSFENIKEGKTVRLRQAYNVRIKQKADLQIFGEFSGDTKIEPVIGWMLETMPVELLMPDASKEIGYAGSELLDKNVGELVYLDRLGFAKIEQKNEKMVKLIFTHK